MSRTCPYHFITDITCNGLLTHADHAGCWAMLGALAFSHHQPAVLQSDRRDIISWIPSFALWVIVT